MKTLYLSAILLLSFSLQAQNAKIEGIVTDDDAAIPFASVILKNASDSSIHKVEYSDENGVFSFNRLTASRFFIEAIFLGFEDYSSEAFQLNTNEEKNIGNIVLRVQSNELDEVVVKSTKPIVQVLPDKTVFNIEGNVNSTGSDALELLRKSPGVVVDNNDNVILQGKSGVQIYIDGRLSNLGGDELTSFLKSLRSDDIEAFEIITSPSSKYDAEGNAGIINIRLKKEKGLGTNGSIGATYSYGYTGKYGANIRLNTRKKNYNLFGSYSFFEGPNRSTLNAKRFTSENRVEFNSVFDSEETNHNARVGMDFFLSDKHTLGALVSGYMSDQNLVTTTKNTLFGSDGDAFARLRANNLEDSNRENLNYNLNYVYQISEGASLSVDLDYGSFRSDASSMQPNSYFDPVVDTLFSEIIYENVTPTSIDIYTAKADFDKKIGELTLGTGVKYSSVGTENAIDFYYFDESDKILDPNRSNQFDYTENIMAGYVNVGFAVDKVNFSLGLRGENTYSLGELTSDVEILNDRVERDYFNLFPSASASIQANEKNTFRLGFSRRVQRPNYQELNPFEFRLDETSFRKGNPFLNPQFTNTIELSHQFNYRLNTTLSYSHTTDLMTRITDTAGQTEAFLTTINLASQDVISLNVSYPFSPAKWWNVFANLSAFKTMNNADFGETKTINIDKTTANIFVQNTFSLPKDYAIELSGFYSSPSVWGGNFETEQMWSLDFGVKKSLWNGKASAKLGVTDLFYTQTWTAMNELGDLIIKANGGRESRRLNLSFNYNFGDNEVKRSRRRDTGLEDEKGRISND